MHHRYDDCPDGYCCVRDEFLPTFVYCKKIGIKDDNCSTRTSESDCPCMEGLDCKPNIKSATFVSLYGKCVNATEEESDDMF
nr:hypothetical protein BaRGS_009288 [Batillaria attramentaria]